MNREDFDLDNVNCYLLLYWWARSAHHLGWDMETDVSLGLNQLPVLSCRRSCKSCCMEVLVVNLNGLNRRNIFDPTPLVWWTVNLLLAYPAACPMGSCSSPSLSLYLYKVLRGWAEQSGVDVSFPMLKWQRWRHYFPHLTFTIIFSTLPNDNVVK